MPFEVIALAAGLAAVIAILLAAYLRQKKEGKHEEEDPLTRYAHGHIDMPALARDAAKAGVRGVSRTFGKGGMMHVKVYDKIGNDIWVYNTRDEEEVERLSSIRELANYIKIHPERSRARRKR
jgi:hypothetical protein